jgi:hypothetical protein
VRWEVQNGGLHQKLAKSGKYLFWQSKMSLAQWRVGIQRQTQRIRVRRAKLDRIEGVKHTNGAMVKDGVSWRQVRRHGPNGQMQWSKFKPIDVAQWILTMKKKFKRI